jgi:hypothetical protein
MPVFENQSEVGAGKDRFGGGEFLGQVPHRLVLQPAG